MLTALLLTAGMGARRAEGWTYFRGYVSNRDTIGEARGVTLDEAKSRCEADPECKAFTYTTRAVGGQVATYHVFFKGGVTVVDDPLWISLVKTRDDLGHSAHPSVRRGDKDAGCGELSLETLDSRTRALQQKIDEYVEHHSMNRQSAKASKCCAALRGEPVRGDATEVADERCMTREVLVTLETGCQDRVCTERVAELRERIHGLCDALNRIDCSPPICHAFRHDSAVARLALAASRRDAQPSQWRAGSGSALGASLGEPGAAAPDDGFGAARGGAGVGLSASPLDGVLVGCIDLSELSRVDAQHFRAFFEPPSAAAIAASGGAGRMAGGRRADALDARARGTVLACARACAEHANGTTYLAVERGACACGVVFIHRERDYVRGEQCGAPCRRESARVARAGVSLPCGRRDHVAVYSTRRLLTLQTITAGTDESTRAWELRGAVLQWGEQSGLPAHGPSTMALLGACACAAALALAAVGAAARLRRVRDAHSHAEAAGVTPTPPASRQPAACPNDDVHDAAGPAGSWARL